MKIYFLFLAMVVVGCGLEAGLGGVVYYEHAGVLRRMNADGTGDELVSELYGHQDMGLTLSVSRNGSVLVFSSNAHGGWSIYRYDFDEGLPLPLYDSNDWDGLPALCPSGRRLAFASMGHGAGAQLYLLRLDNPGEVQRLTSTDNWARWPVWTHDGAQIYFVHFSPGDSHSELCRLTPSGSVVTAGGRPAVPKRFRGEIKEPVLSPDGATLALSYKPHNADSFDIYLYELETEKLTRLTSESHDCVSPCFDGTGRYLYFNSSFPVDAPIWPLGLGDSDEEWDHDYLRNPGKRLPEMIVQDDDVDGVPLEDDEGSADAPEYPYGYEWLASYQNRLYRLELATGEIVELATGEDARWCAR